MITVLPPRKMPDEVVQVLETTVDEMKVSIIELQRHRNAARSIERFNYLTERIALFTARRDAIADYLKQNA